MAKRRRRRRVRFGSASQESAYRQVLSALRAAEQARSTTNCKSAWKTFTEAELYYGQAVLDLIGKPITLDVKKALSTTKRELRMTRDRLALKCAVRI